MVCDDCRDRSLTLLTVLPHTFSATHSLCQVNNWVKPSVYQGMYSTITRQVEEELIPCLRYHDIAFYAYSPLGGGILSGKYQFQDQSDKKIPKGRFNGVGWDKVYRDRYWKEEHFQSMEKLKGKTGQKNKTDFNFLFFILRAFDRTSSQRENHDTWCCF